MKLSRFSRWTLAAVLTALALMLLHYAAGVRSMAPLEALPAAQVSVTEAVSLETGPLVDINTAGLEELMTLPGIGEVRARAILDYRAEHGPFRYPEDLIRVDGIGEGIVRKLLDYVTTGGAAYAEDISG